MLIQPHAAGDPVHDQAKALGGHSVSSGGNFVVGPMGRGDTEINPLDKYCPAGFCTASPSSCPGLTRASSS
jgi:hypothetical protein